MARSRTFGTSSNLIGRLDSDTLSSVGSAAKGGERLRYEGNEWRGEGAALAMGALRVTLSTYPKLSASSEALTSTVLNMLCEHQPSPDSRFIKSYVGRRQAAYIGAFETVMVTGSDAAVERSVAWAEGQGDADVLQFTRQVTTKLKECRKRLLEFGFKGGVFPDQMSPLQLTSNGATSTFLFMVAVDTVASYHMIISEMEPYGSQ